MTPPTGSPSGAVSASRGVEGFPVGYYHLHPDVSLNFQMNRWYTWVGDTQMLSEMRAVAPTIHSYPEFTRAFLGLAEHAIANNQDLKGAFYLRAAEFFMFPDDPAKHSTRAEFLKLITRHYGVEADDCVLVPYDSGALPAYRFMPDHPRGTIVVFGGFDSYIEEWFAAFLALRDAGYDVVAFEGPGQGRALEDFRLPMTFDWNRPVKAILDCFKLDGVTLMGFSLGGGLVIRAAADEPRVHRVIADDILTDFLEVNLRQAARTQRVAVKALVLAGAERAVNQLVHTAMRRSLVVDWGVRQGMHVTGTASPYKLFRELARYRTAPFSNRLTQDVLLMCATEDHYVPPRQFIDQIRSLTNVRSLTARRFTREEQAHNHCHIGNFGLSLKVITSWIETTNEPVRLSAPDAM